MACLPLKAKRAQPEIRHNRCSKGSSKWREGSLMGNQGRVTEHDVGSFVKQYGSSNSCVINSNDGRYEFSHFH